LELTKGKSNELCPHISRCQVKQTISRPSINFSNIYPEDEDHYLDFQPPFETHTGISELDLQVQEYLGDAASVRGHVHNIFYLVQFL